MKKCPFLKASKGLFHAYAPAYKVTLVDAKYNGLKLVYKTSENPLRGSSGFTTDCIEIKSHLDGKIYNSKSKYYQSLKDAGTHVIEKGEIKDKPREIAGDYNVRKELTQAVQRHLR